MLVDKIKKLSLTIAYVAIWLAVIGLFYKALLYDHLPMTPGDPYGLADMIDVFFGLSILMISSLSFLLAFATALFQKDHNYTLTIKATALSLAALVLYYFLYPFML